MPVVYIHTIVTAKGVLKDFLNKEESLLSQYYCMWINRKYRYTRRQKCCINAWLLCNLFPKVILSKLAFLVISAIRNELFIEISSKSNKPHSMLQ